MEREIDIPDAVETWQRLSDACTNVDAAGARGATCVGLVDSISETDALPFWYTLFVELGFSVRTPRHDPAGLNSLNAHGRETIPSESVCYPAKISHIHAANVIEAGANVLFMPLYDRYSRCAVSCEYANAVGYNMPQVLGEPGRVWDGDLLPCELPAGYAVFASPLLLLRKPWRIIDYPPEIVQLLRCLNALLPDEDEISVDEILQALMLAADAQGRFQRTIDAENARALAWAHEPGHHGILLVGRPYHWDRSLLHDLNYMLVELGFSVMTSHPDLDARKKPAGRPTRDSYDSQAAFAEADARWGAGSVKDDAEGLMVERTYADRAARAEGKPVPRTTLDMEPMQNLGDRAQAVPFWRAAKHVGKLCQKVALDPDLDLVCLQSFGCGYDAASIPEAREIIRAAHKPFTLLMIDDSVTTAHLKIRLRTLAAAIRQRKSSTELQKDALPYEGASGVALPEEAQRKLLTPLLTREILEAVRDRSVAAFSGLCADDYEAARPYAENYCYLTALLVGRTLRICTTFPKLKTLVVPYVCYGCLEDALPRTVIRTLGRNINIIWERNWLVPEQLEVAKSRFQHDRRAGSSPLRCEVTQSAISLEPESFERAALHNGHTQDVPSWRDPCSSSPDSLSRGRTSNSPTSPLYGRASSSPFAAEPRNKRPQIGIVGLPPLVFEESLNDGLLQIIKNAGCEPILPSLENLLVDDIGYADQLEKFALMGVDHVLYLMSFACLKGHTEVRAKMSELRKQYPQMPITIIDYDGDASSLNRQNRIALALAT